MSLLSVLCLTAIAQAQPASPVGVDKTRFESITKMHVVTGEVAVRRRSTVASEEAGLVLSAEFDAGDRVESGQTLAVLNDELLRLQLAQLQAELLQEQAKIEEAQVRVDRARRDLNDLENLLQRQAAQQKELEDARSEVASAQAAIKSTQSSAELVEARIRTMEHRLSLMTVKAPFAGVVVLKNAEKGQWVAAGGAIAEIIELDRIDAELRVPEYLVNDLAIGTSIEVMVSGAGEPTTGSVRAIVPEGDLRARTYPVKIELDNSDGRFLPGMSAKAWVPTARFEDVLTIDRDAVLSSPTGPYVYVVRGDAVFPVSIEILSSAGVERYAVRGELGPDMMVVVEGNEQLYPSAKVMITRGAEAES